jgi:hypothetical protein
MRIETGQVGRLEAGGYPEDLETWGLGPCTGVFVYNATSKVGWGAHLVAPALEDLGDLRHMLANAAEEFEGSTSVTVFMSGCCAASGGKPATRATVEAEVRAAFPNAKLDLRWPGRHVRSVDMLLDVETGNLTVNEH